MISYSSHAKKLLKAPDPGKVLVFATILLLFLPRVAKKGMFGDGLLYASIARNMAEGRGSFWSPFFSSSYWLESIPKIYYENPPLMLWLESFLFYVLGDHWWIEKLFSALVLLLNILLFRFLWHSIFNESHSYRKYWYVTLFWWYCIPVVIWGNVNNLMDNLLLSFCLGSTGFFIRGIKNNSFSFTNFLIGSLFVFGGILTKGPVALYPIALPAIYWLVWSKPSFSKTFTISLFITSISVGLFLVLLVLMPDAKHFFSEYWDQRLKAVIVGSRNDMALSGWSKTYIIQQLLFELTPSLIILGLLLLYARLKNIVFSIQTELKNALVFVLTGLAATLPILISTKQSGIYLLPGIPMFSVAFAILSLPIVLKLFSSESIKTHRMLLNIMFLVIAFSGVILATNNFGKTRREASLIKDIETLKTMIPPFSKIGVCEETMESFVMHTYMQRMAKYELCAPTTFPKYIVSENTCQIDPTRDISTEYRKINLKGLSNFSLYQKME